MMRLGGRKKGSSCSAQLGSAAYLSVCIA